MYPEVIALSNKKQAKFPVGQIVSTTNALSKLTHEDIITALSRHVKGDWGEVDEEDRQENEL